MRNGKPVVLPVGTEESLALLSEAPLVRVPLSAGTAEGFSDWLLSTALPPGVRTAFLVDGVWIGGETLDLNVTIPVTAFTPAGFVEWAMSPAFAERGRISLIDEELWIDMSPEAFETHLKVKDALTAALQPLNRQLRLGEYLSDGAMLTFANGTSTVPDALLVTFESSRSGRVRMIPCRDHLGDFTRIEGPPDWVVEVISRSSIEKDTQRLRRQYLRAGVAEYWIIDARGEDIDWHLLVRRGRRFTRAVPRNDWLRSPFFGRRFRLERRRNEVERYDYELLVSPD